MNTRYYSIGSFLILFLAPFLALSQAFASKPKNHANLKMNLVEPNLHPYKAVPLKNIKKLESFNFAEIALRFKGFYLGINFGEQISQVSSESSVNVNLPNTLYITIANEPSENSPSLMGGLALGCSIVARKGFYLAIEGRADIEQTKTRGGQTLEAPDNTVSAQQSPVNLI